MAEAKKGWCFDINTNKLGDLESAAAAYLAEFDKIQANTTDEQWESITSAMNFGAHPEIQKFETKPPTPILGSDWWKLRDPDCWGEVRSYGENFYILDEIRAIATSFEIISTSINTTTGATAVGSINPADFQLIEQFINNSQGWKSLTFSGLRLDIEYLVSVVLRGVNPQLVQPIVDAVTKIESKLANFKCFTTEEIRGQWEAAVQKLYDPEEKRKRAENEKKKSGGSIRDGTRLGGPAGIDKDGKIRAAMDAKTEAEIAADRARIAKEIEEIFADDIAFGQQCILLSYMSEIIESKEARDQSLEFKQQLPYVSDGYNKPIKLVGEPFGFMNRLVVDPTQKEFFDIDNATLSSLIPHMRFFKVAPDDKGNDVETEIEFDSNGKNSIFKGNVYRKQRGHGVGLKSFNFSYDGTDPFSAKKMIAAKLSIYASTFDELLRERQDPNNRTYQYAELALKTGGFGDQIKDLDEIEKLNLDKLNFRLKATLGWSIADNKVFKKLEKNNLALYNAIYNSFITIYLTPTIHNFSFDETGAVTFDIEYLAYIEDVFSQKTYNIFSFLTKEIMARESVFDYFKGIGCTNLDPESEDETSSSEEFKKFLKEDEKVVANINTDAFTLLMKKMQERDRIYYLNFNKEDMKKLVDNPTADVAYPDPTTAPNNGSLATTIASSVRSAASTAGIDADEALLSVVAVSQENNNIPFFYFGDLLEVVMMQIEDSLKQASENILTSEYFDKIRVKVDSFDAAQIGKYLKDKQTNAATGLQQFRKMRVLLGPIEMFNPLKTDKVIITTLANIPISTNYFFEFMSDRILSKEIISYPFSKFMKDLVNDLIENFLNSDSCTRVDKSQKIKLNTTTINAYNKLRPPPARDLGKIGKNGQFLDDITLSMLFRKPYKDSQRPVLLLGGTRNTPKEALSLDRMVSYFVYSVGRKSPVSNYVGNKGADERNGIFHYIIGKDKGFVKNITLEKTTATGLKEVRFEQEGYNGLEQLREVYNAKIETFLNVQTFPGTYVYVEPHGFAPNTTTDLTRYGIGGYCMVVKTEHSISPGTADTTLHTVWVASKEGNSPKNKKNSTNSAATTTRAPEGPEATKKCLVGPHNIGLLVTRRGRYKGVSDQQAGEVGSQAVKSGIYEV
jgi:hypothetical protein